MLDHPVEKVFLLLAELRQVLMGLELILITKEVALMNEVLKVDVGGCMLMLD